MTHDTPSYGLWGLVLVNSAVFILFAFSFFKPQTKRDWRTFGSFSAFLVTLFAEMNGFPLTIYLLSGWLQSQFPEANMFSHQGGHLWYSLLGLEGDPHFHPVHLASHAVIAFGFLLLAASWKVLYDAQRDGSLATTGPYAYVRHPVRRVHSHHAGVSPPVADASDASHVPRSRRHVRPARSTGRTGGSSAFRTAMGQLRGSYAWLRPQIVGSSPWHGPLMGTPRQVGPNGGAL